jgi:hypothetical protein
MLRLSVASLRAFTILLFFPGDTKVHIVLY